MRIIATLIFSFIFCAQSSCGDPIAIRLSHFQDKDYSFELSHAAISKAPKWSPDADFPPLSARKAKEIALSLAQKLRPDIGIWHLDAIEIQPINDSDWIYLIKYSDRSGPLAGVPWSLAIPIYMNGTIPELIIKNRP